MLRCGRFSLAVPPQFGDSSTFLVAVPAQFGDSSTFLVTVPPQFGDHKFKERLLLYAGQSTAIEIPYFANPQPTATWSYNTAKKMPDSRRFKTDTIRNMSSLTISKAQRSDKGNYSLTLENQYGKTSFSFELVVLGT